MDAVQMWHGACAPINDIGVRRRAEGCQSGHRSVQQPGSLLPQIEAHAAVGAAQFSGNDGFDC